MNTKAMRAGLLAFAVMAGGAAQAESLYLIGGGLYEIGDSSRDSDNGLGLQLGVGLPVGDSSDALEISLKAIERDRDSGGSDRQFALFGNYLKALDSFEFIGGGEPYLLAGLGAVQEDVASDKHFHFGLDGGAGVRWPLGFLDSSLRAEALAQAQLNDKSAPDEDYLLDFHVGLGWQVPFGGGGDSFSEPDDSPVEAPECPVKAVDPVTGRTDCATDSDRDGVIDGTDLCPGTPTGTKVDGAGCTVGGVIDSDGDGVLDDVDACPSTTSGLVVDGTGCIVEQTVTLRAVRFETASARLTRNARTALDEVAVTLKNQRTLNAEIAGHTDDQGNDNFNLLLSQERAESVRQYLIGRNVAPERLTARGYGEAKPVAGNDTAEGRDANRRVEFRVSVQ